MKGNAKSVADINLNQECFLQGLPSQATQVKEEATFGEVDRCFQVYQSFFTQNVNR